MKAEGLISEASVHMMATEQGVSFAEFVQGHELRQCSVCGEWGLADQVVSATEDGGGACGRCADDMRCDYDPERGFVADARAPQVRHPEIVVELTGSDGNAFAVMGAVRRAMRRGGVPTAEIEEYTAESTSGDYDNLLQTAMRWVTVE